MIFRGYEEASYNVTVSPDGTIRDTAIVACEREQELTIEQATDLIIKRLSQIHAGLKNGTVTAQVTLGNIRSIKVTIIGEITQPGTYTLPSLATVFNALYASGGPTVNGSFRDIELVRNNKIIAHLDLYDFLLKGDQKDNLRLQDQDVIRVNAYTKSGGMFGEMKDPGYYEAKQGEKLNDLIKFAGGFTDQAYTERIKVLKKNNHERSIADIEEKDLATYQPQNGDRFIVDVILNKYTNRVLLKGAVYREGPFEMEQGLTVMGLLKKADGVRGDAFPERAYIKRTREDLTTEIISFNLKDMLSGKVADIVLQKDDELNIPSIMDLKEPYTVIIQGEVLKPGQFMYSDKMSVEDMLIMAGGLKASASNRVSIARRLKLVNADVKNNQLAETIQYDLNTHKDEKGNPVILEPFDIVIVRMAPGYEEQKLVNIEGEILYPGNYAVLKKTERISDLVKRAGGLTSEALCEWCCIDKEK